MCNETYIRFRKEHAILLNMLTSKRQTAEYNTYNIYTYNNTQGGQKSKLLILSEYVNKTEKIGGM